MNTECIQASSDIYGAGVQIDDDIDDGGGRNKSQRTKSQMIIYNSAGSSLSLSLSLFSAHFLDGHRGDFHRIKMVATHDFDNMFLFSIYLCRCAVGLVAPSQTVHNLIVFNSR